MSLAKPSPFNSVMASLLAAIMEKRVVVMICESREVFCGRTVQTVAAGNQTTILQIVADEGMCDKRGVVWYFSVELMHPCIMVSASTTHTRSANLSWSVALLMW